MTKSLKVAAFLAFKSIIRGSLGVILLTIFILALVALNLLFVPSLLEGLVWSANDKLINTFTGDIVIESAGDEPLIQDVDRFITRIEEIYGVLVATPRNSLGAEITFENERTNCMVYGIQPERESIAFRIDESLIEGSYLNANDQDEILLGVQLAGADKPDIELYSRSLKKVHAGDKVLVKYANGIQKPYKVKGIFHVEFIQTDLQAFLSEKEFKTINPLVENRAASIYVKIGDGVDAAKIIEQIDYPGSELRILTWEDYAGIVRSMTDSFNVINAILNTVNLLVAGITVFIVTYIDVANRRRQIGIQRAIGITDSSITMAYLIRALFYAIVGAILASLTFVYAVMPVEATYPFHFPFGDVYLNTGFLQLTRAASILVCASLVAAFVPVWMALRIKILDAIWG